MREVFVEHLGKVPDEKTPQLPELSPEERTVLVLNAERIGQAEEQTDTLIAKIDAALDVDSENPDTTEVKQVKEELTAVREKAKGLRDTFIEGTYMFLRLAAFGGIALLARDIGLHFNKPDFSKKDEAQKELKEKGITKYQRRAYIPGVNNLIHRSINPYSYLNHNAKEVYKNLLYGRRIIENPSQEAVEWIDKTRVKRDDAWRLYLGLPQEHNTFDISTYRPSKSVEGVYYYKIIGFFENWWGWGDGKDLIKLLHERTKDGSTVELDSLSGVMGEFKLSQGKDEKGHYISYYDKWKLDIGPEKGGGFFGKPFEIYDRIYYDLETFEPIDVALSGK